MHIKKQKIVLCTENNQKLCRVLPLPRREKAKTVKNNKMAGQNTNSHLCYWMQFQKSCEYSCCQDLG